MAASAFLRSRRHGRLSFDRRSRGARDDHPPMPVQQPRPRRRKPLDAGPFAPEIGSFRLHLAAEGKAPKTVRTYTEAVQWFAAAHLIPRTSRTRWDEVDGHDVQRWLVHLLTRYSDAYASNQFRALQQFFRWLAEEEQLPDPMDHGTATPTGPAAAARPSYRSEQHRPQLRLCDHRPLLPRCACLRVAGHRRSTVVAAVAGAPTCCRQGR
jgi:hypothetical protein